MRGGVMMRMVAMLAALGAGGAIARAEPPAPGVTVDFVNGDVLAIGPDGARRPIAKGDALAPGDQVATGQGRAQLRFSDGGVVDLAPDSAFRIDAYAFDGAEDGTERKLMTLLKGALRTISGAIGHLHQETYRLDTPVASIGIRGTGYTADLSLGLRVEVGEGAVVVANQAGAVQIQRGQAGFVRDAFSAPVLTPKLNMVTPEDGPSRARGDRTTANNGSNGSKETSGAAGAAGSGAAANAGGGAKGGTGGSVSADLGRAAAIEVGGAVARPEALQALPGDPAITAPSQMTGAAPVESASLDGIGWSRWVSADGQSPVHLLTGTPLIQLPTQGGARYTLTGGSGPTYANGRGGVGTASGAIDVAFAGARTTIALDLALTMADGAAYRLASTGGLDQPGQSQIVLGKDGIFGTEKLGVSATTGVCVTATCQGSLTGFFAGTAAERAALAYGVVALPDAAGTTTVTPVLSGTAVFTKGPAKTGSLVSAPVTGLGH